MPQAPEETLEIIDKQAGALPREDVLVFIRNKRNNSNERRLVNSHGLWTRSSGGAVAPLAEDRGRRFQELRGQRLQDAEELADYIKAL